MGRVAGKRECGVCGRVRRIEIRARDGRPDICTSCTPSRPGTCGVCGRTVRIARKATDDSPAVGICCYELPIAVCTDCRRTKPCYHARGPEPVCPSCTALRRAPICLDCGQRRVAHRRVDGGVICGSCDRKRGGTTAACHRCGTTAPLIKRLCATCRLREQVAELAARADPTSAVAAGAVPARSGRGGQPTLNAAVVLHARVRDHPPAARGRHPGEPSRARRGRRGCTEPSRVCPRGAGGQWCARAAR